MSKLYRVGFTGTQEGMTDAQKKVVADVLIELRDEALDSIYADIWFLHGNCIGADEQAAMIASSIGYATEAFPGDIPAKQSRFVSTKTHPLEDNIVRNHRVVDKCDVLVAAPKGVLSERRSGTWATIRYAQLERRRTIIAYPDGDKEWTDW